MDNNISPHLRIEDRLSNLPDDLILKIMSCLDITEVVRTCVLSRKWRHFWKHVSTINFTYATSARYQGKERFPSFLDFVDRVLFCREDSDIHRFIFTASDSYIKPSLIMGSLNTWIYSLLRHNIQEIALKVNNTKSLRFEFPRDLYHSKSLTKLELIMAYKEFADLDFPRSICLPQLQYLCLESFALSSMDSVNLLISSCPDLEKVVLSDIDTYVKDQNQNFVIHTSTLKHLELKNIRYLDLEENSVLNPTTPIIVIAPNLKTFICQDFMFRENICFRNDLSSLVTADVVMSIDNTYGEYTLGEDLVSYANILEAKKEEFSASILKLLRALNGAKEFKLSPGILEVFAGAPDLLVNGCHQFDNCRCLKLDIWLTGGCLCVITYLLEIFSNIESLHLTSKESNLRDADDDWEARFSHPCMLSHLKVVEIGEVRGYDTEVKLLEFLLKYGVALENLAVVHAYPEDRVSVEQVTDFEKKIKSFPRASSDVKIQFRYHMATGNQGFP